MNNLKLIVLEERIVLDAVVGAVILHVTTSSDSGSTSPGGLSLRDAVNIANAHPGQDLIVFNSNVQSVNLQSPLVISGAVTIDGSNSSALGGKVAITGSGIDLAANNSTLKNLNISSNSANGIGVLMAGSNDTLANDVISGNYKAVDETGGSNTYKNDFIGTDYTGTTAVGNSFGLYLEGSGHDTISGNVISGNVAASPTLIDPTNAPFQMYGGGIWIASASAGYNTISNNHIGTDITGTKVIENGAGILAFGGNNLIQGNQLAGFHTTGTTPTGGAIGSRGIVVLTGADNNIIQNNLFDGYVNQSGQYVMLPNANNEINLDSNNNLVQNNVMLGASEGAPITVEPFLGAAPPSGNQIISNFLGTDPKGNAVPNSTSLIGIWLNSSQTLVEYNQISSPTGVYFYRDSGSTIAYNHIFNTQHGFISWWGDSFTTIKGNTINVIAAPAWSDSAGLYLWGSYGDTIQGNTIIGGAGAQGISLRFAANDQITGNTILSNNGAGINAVYVDTLTISNNFISGATVGLVSVGNDNTQILNNVFTNPGSVPWFDDGPGVLHTQADAIFMLAEGPLTTVSGNVITGNLNNPIIGPAIVDIGSLPIASTGNLVSGFSVGLALQGGSNWTSSNDAFLGNTVGIQLDSGNQLSMSQDLITGLGKKVSTTSFGVQLTGSNNTVSISNSVLSLATNGFSGDSSSNSITLTSNLFALDHYGVFDTSASVHKMVLNGNQFLLDDFNMNF